MLKPHPRSVAAARPSARLRRVLIVDDNRDAADTLGALLVFMGYDVRVVYDSEMGLDEAAWFEPEVAIWDIALPGVDGYEAARRLREGADGRKTLLIALTAHGTAEDVKAAHAAGFDRHLTKPVEVGSLLVELGS
jgi:DNA-binding response OmpR family regulator